MVAEKTPNLTFVEHNQPKNFIPKSISKLEFVRNLTHLYMNDKYLQKIGDLKVCENLQVLYLHNNDIFRIQNLASLKTLKHLYLQKNRIKRMEGLNTLKNLKKLYLGHNEFSVLEGIEHLKKLEELYVENQHMTKGESLVFDPRCVMSLANTLQILNISHNNIVSISDLEPLKLLKVFNASYNSLDDILEAATVLHNWMYLTEVNFIGNPMTKIYRYKDCIIANTFRLATLDNKDINETTRTFIKRFEYEKTQPRFSSQTRFNLVPKNFPGSIPPVMQNIISKQVSKSLDKCLSTCLVASETEYLPWKALKAPVSDSGQVVPPLFIKQQRITKDRPKKVHFDIVPVRLHNK